jgi:hypothetical protein
MKTTIALVIALVLGGTSAYAQGGPPGKMQGAPGLREQGPGPGPGAAGPRGNDASPAQAPDRAARAGPLDSRGDRGGRQAQEHREQKVGRDRAEKEHGPARAERGDSPGRGERAEKEDKRVKPQDRAEDRVREEKGKPPQAAEDRKGAPQRDSTAEKKAPEPGAPSKQATTGDRKEDAKRVDLSGDKRDRVKTAFREKGDVKHYTNVNVDLRVGARLPRNFVFVPVPIAVIDIVPEYRDYYFAYVDDDYVICDPDTYEIVAVIPVSGGPSYASGSDRCSDRLSLSADEKDLVAEAISREDRGRTSLAHRLERSRRDRAAEIPRPGPLSCR